jgi:hypothetical protein
MKYEINLELFPKIGLCFLSKYPQNMRGTYFQLKCTVSHDTRDPWF